MIILTNREAELADVLDPSIHVHRTIPPTEPMRLNAPAPSNIAVIWVNDEGEPPKFGGIWLHNRAGGYTKIPYYDRNADPLCYPLLFPRGTQGYHYRIPNADFEKILDGTWKGPGGRF